MNILMISDVYFPRINGVSTSIESFRRALVAEGHRVTLICPAYPVGDEEDPQIIRIPSRGVISDPEDRMMHYRRILALSDELASRQFDIVHVHTPFVAHYAGLALARRLGLPVIESYHTFFEEYLYHYLPWLPSGLLRWAARRFSASQCNAVDALVVPSSPMQAVLTRYGVRTGMSVIPTGIALDRFRTPPVSDFRATHEIAPDRPVLLFVGRAAHEKNIGFLIDIMPAILARHPEALLVIAGEGPAREALATQVRKTRLQDSVRFVGYMRRDGQLQDAYRAADLFVFASRTETQGLVLLEAMALGTPVVSTAVMGTRDVLRDGAGCLVAEDDPRDFADKVCRLLDDPAWRARLGDSAQAYVQDWDEREKAAQLARRYEQLIDAHDDAH
ncbi:MAG: glycosyltransferase [Halothiobacillaceae bacterium]